MSKWYEVLKNCEDAQSQANVLAFIVAPFYIENKQDFEQNTMTVRKSVIKIEEILNREFNLPEI